MREKEECYSAKRRCSTKESHIDSESINVKKLIHLFTGCLHILEWISRDWLLTCILHKSLSAARDPPMGLH